MSREGVRNCTAREGLVTHIPAKPPVPQATLVSATEPETQSRPEYGEAARLIGRVVEVETRTARLGLLTRFI